MNFMRGSLMASVIKNLIKDGIVYDIKIFMVTSYDSEKIPNDCSKSVDKVFTKPMSLNMMENIFYLS